MHIFEKAGLGTYPFELAQVDVGKCKCDYCGTNIKYIFTIQGATGNKFVVGSSCVFKTGDSGLTHEVKRAIKRRKKEAERSKLSLLPELLKSKDIEAKLLTIPHPKWSNKTFFDYATWMIKNAGNTGRLKLFATISAHCPELLDYKAEIEDRLSMERQVEAKTEVPEWKRRVEEQAKNSTFQGTVGSRLEVEGTMEFSREINSAWGPCKVYKFVDDNENVYNVFTRHLDVRQGDKYAIRGTVKQFSEFKECKQTVLNRVKILREVPQDRVPISEPTSSAGIRTIDLD